MGKIWNGRAYKVLLHPCFSISPITRGLLDLLSCMRSFLGCCLPILLLPLLDTLFPRGWVDGHLLWALSIGVFAAILLPILSQRAAMSLYDLSHFLTQRALLENAPNILKFCFQCLENIFQPIWVLLSKQEFMNIQKVMGEPAHPCNPLIIIGAPWINLTIKDIKLSNQLVTLFLPLVFLLLSKKFCCFPSFTLLLQLFLVPILQDICKKLSLGFFTA